MKVRLIMVLMALIGSLLITALPVEAKRLGSGQSLGKQAPAQSYQSSSPSAARPSTPSQQASPASHPAPAASGASRWLGPLAGLAAGGLLASLFFGGAFSGLQFMDMILLAGLAVGAYFLIRALRSRSAAGQSSPVEWSPAGGGHGAPIPGSILERDLEAEASYRGGADSLAATQDPRLSGFNQDEFLSAARKYYVQLTAAWDANRMSEIQEFTTPELYKALLAERIKLGHEENVTEVIQLRADMQSLHIEGHQLVASVFFSGTLREAVGAAPQPFSELWHIERSLNPPSATWFISGIQQTG
ncbi:MAG: TIM44-like domain-containing protein [Pseudomonadota bacterium]